MKVKLENIKSDGNVRRFATNKKSRNYIALKNNIAKLGMITPVTVSKNGNGYIVLDGHQRLSVANDLKWKEVPVHVTEYDAKERALRQASANLININMSLFDCAYAINEIQSSNNSITVKELSTLFGKDSRFVGTALLIANVIPNVMSMMKKAFENGYDLDEYIEGDIGVFAKLTKDQQTKIWDEYRGLDYDKDDIDEFVWYISDKTSIYNMTGLVEMFGEKKYRAAEKVYGFVNEYEGSLFESYAKNNYCTETKFLLEHIFPYTLVGGYLYKHALPQMVEQPIKYNYDEKQMRVTYYALNNKDVLKELKSKSINKWSVSNNLNVTIQQNAITVNKDGKEENVEVDPHKLTYGKLNRFMVNPALIYYNTVIKDNITTVDENGLNILLQWYLNNGVSLDLNDYQARENGFKFNSKDLCTKDGEVLNNESFLHEALNFWFEHYEGKFRYQELADLGKAYQNAGIKIHSFEEQVYSYYDQLKDKVKFFNNFNLYALNVVRERYNIGTKGDHYTTKKGSPEHIVASNAVNEFPFKPEMKKAMLDAGWDKQMIRFQALEV